MKSLAAALVAADKPHSASSRAAVCTAPACSPTSREGRTCSTRSGADRLDIGARTAALCTCTASAAGCANDETGARALPQTACAKCNGGTCVHEHARHSRVPFPNPRAVFFADFSMCLCQCLGGRQQDALSGDPRHDALLVHALRSVNGMRRLWARSNKVYNSELTGTVSKLIPWYRG